MVGRTYSDPGEGAFLREHVDIHAVPFVDKDGVQKGDQGKLRHPHDHWEDYRGESIYAATRELKRQSPSWRGEFALALDLHCPYYRDDFIHFVAPEPDWMPRFDRFVHILSGSQQGPLRFDPKDCVPYGVGWNCGNSDFGEYFRQRGGAGLAFIIEFPYALVKGPPVTVAGARSFGGDLARAMVRYIQGQGS